MNLLSGYDPAVVIRSHKERLEKMRASRRLPNDCAPNPACVAAGLAGSLTRDEESFRRGVAARDDRRLIALAPPVVARIAEMRAVLGPEAARRHLNNISQTTLSRIIAGARVSHSINERVLAGIAKPFAAPPDAMVRADADTVAQIRAVITLAGNMKNAAYRLQVGYRCMRLLAAAKFVKRETLDRVKARLAAQEPMTAGGHAWSLPTRSQPKPLRRKEAA